MTVPSDPAPAAPTFGTVLLIDDDPINNLICEELIRIKGFARQVCSFLDASEALAWLRARSREAWPELIFLDINMPGMNGWEFLEAFGALPDTASVAVIILSSSVSERDQAKARSYALVKEYQVKPLRPGYLDALSAEV